ncbi:peptidoglycan DD-metalloendopeptidase family protein [Salinicola halophilus]|uniref:peptidoglycan DD-metalloendopeptidase family protein n=1 Tax=Salinicola halophilus TaxID=184065 RepID=UPI000DA16F07|nr:peptidoglycan DD-metalloendopeptidase family protein [Salinicola halophilus]
MNKRRTALLLSLLPVAAMGLNACTTSSGRPQVQDLSVSRSSQASQTYTVKSGDTIYGIAWQNRVDFRDLAQMNAISPPYRLEPGQQLRLRSGAELTSQPQVASNTNAAATATPLGGGGGSNSSGSAGSDNPSWLLPSAGGSAAAGASAAGASASAGQSGGGSQPAAGGATLPGSSTTAGSAPAGGAGSSDVASRDERAPSSPSASEPAPAAAQAETPSTPAAGADTGSSSSSASMANTDTRTAAGNDAGTEVAGEPSGAPDRSDRTYKPVDNVPWQWPVAGRVVSNFDDQTSITPGIDIAGQKGQPVKAAGPGIVVYAGDGVRGYGNLIILKHNDRFLSAYAHNDTLRVQENDVVEAGETIATMGQTDADQVQLHFEVRVNGQPQDPLQYLPKR